MLRRAIQIACLAGFLALLTAAILGLAEPEALHFVLGLDPAAVLPTALAGRAFVTAFVPAVILLALGPLLGRAFCGWICPMGTLIDGLDALAARIRKRRGRRRLRQPRLPEGARRLKFAVLGLILGAAALGLSLVHLASPLTLMTRFWGLLVYPLLSRLADAGLILLRPVGGLLDWNALTFAQLRTPPFETWPILLALLAGLAAAAFVMPRLWCRVLCPAGALLALVSWRPLARRRVDRRCGSCALCADVCPMGAIEDDGFRMARHGECILCASCQGVCPKTSVTFLSGDDEAETAVPAVAYARRQLMVGGLAGLGSAALALPGWAAGTPRPEDLGPVRPPGALPEAEFLARCIRCGACVAVCPTKALEPLVIGAGVEGIFSPGLVPKGGPCDPHCTTCGDVCPTAAIRRLVLDERRWARSGTAAIDEKRCIAWADDKRCMVCDEVCPYDAVVFRMEAGHAVAVPTVEAARCTGCGACENACPVEGTVAIRVMPKGALRLSEGSYVEEGRRRGLSIALDTQSPGKGGYREEPAAGSAPGFDGPAPGFSR